MVLADLGVVVQIHVSENETAGGLIAGPANDLDDQRRAAFLEQLVVDGLVEVAEHVHVAPAQLHAEAVLET